jgi:hypothetical protein
MAVGHFEHPSLGEFDWDDDVAGWTRLIEIELLGRTVEVMFVLGDIWGSNTNVTPGQAALAERIATGALVQRWPEVQAVAKPSKFWSFEADYNYVLVSVQDARVWRVEVFAEGSTSEPSSYTRRMAEARFEDPPPP